MSDTSTTPVKATKMNSKQKRAADKAAQLARAAATTMPVQPTETKAIVEQVVGELGLSKQQVDTLNLIQVAEAAVQACVEPLKALGKYGALRGPRMGREASVIHNVFLGCRKELLNANKSRMTAEQKKAAAAIQLAAKQKELVKAQAELADAVA